MILDDRRKLVNRFMVGMADIQLAYNALASEVIVIYNELSIDHYQDSRIAEVERCKKLAIFRKSEDMNYIPQDDFNTDELVEDSDSNIPYEVLLTETGLPRMPRKDDMVLIDGVLYSVHHVKPINRDYRGLWQLIVYPERTTFIDTLHIYKITLLSTKDLKPISDLVEYLNEVDEEPVSEPTGLGMGLGMSLGAVFSATEGDVEPLDEPYEPSDDIGEENVQPTEDNASEEPVIDSEPIEPEPVEPEPVPVPTKEVVVDFVWGGKPEFISLDKTESWIPFKSRIKMELSADNLHPIIYIKGNLEVIQVKL